MRSKLAELSGCCTIAHEGQQEKSHKSTPDKANKLYYFTFGLIIHFFFKFVQTIFRVVGEPIFQLGLRKVIPWSLDHDLNGECMISAWVCIKFNIVNYIKVNCVFSRPL